MEKEPITVPAEAKRGGETGCKNWSWVEPCVWTERMLAALSEGVKGGKWFSLINAGQMHSLRSMGCTRLPQPMRKVANPVAGKTTDWRAGCGRTASPVRREGERNQSPLPTPISPTAATRQRNRRKTYGLFQSCLARFGSRDRIRATFPFLRWIFHRISDELPQAVAYLVADAAEDGEQSIIITFGGSRVVKAPVDALGLSREDGAALSRVITDGDHIVELLSEELIDRFRSLP